MGLIKLMSMVALTIAPLLKEKNKYSSPVGGSRDEGNHDWENWYWGMIPLALSVIVTAILMFKQILTWKDPLATANSAQAKAFRSSTVPNPEEAPAQANTEPKAAE